MLVVMGMTVCVKAQVSVNGDVGFYTKNLSTFTGLMFSEEPAMVAHMNVGVDYKKFNISASYSGQHAIHHYEDGDRFNMLDLSVGYKISKGLVVSLGYEMTYTDTEKDQIGHGVFAMAKWSKCKVSSTLIFFADPSFKNTYYIGSIDLRVMKNVSVYTLAGYTNTKTSPLYGLVGVKYSKGSFFTGTYWVFDKDNPGPVVSAGLTF